MLSYASNVPIYCYKGQLPFICGLKNLLKLESKAATLSIVNDIFFFIPEFCLYMIFRKLKLIN